MKREMTTPGSAWIIPGVAPISPAARIAFCTEAWMMPCTQMSPPIRATYFPLLSETTKFVLQSPPISGRTATLPEKHGKAAT